MTQRLLSKFLSGLLGAFIGLSITAVAQVPGPVNLRGLGGDSIQEVQVPNLGTGGTVTYIPEIAIGSCSGCTTYMHGDYVVHAFTQVANNHSFTPPAGLTSVDVLIVGGGGGGGGYRRGAGGGGAGAVRWEPGASVTPLSPITVTVGDGGAGGSASNNDSGNGQSGSPSSFGALQANGGGGGLRGDQPTVNAPTVPSPNGGSGGGGGSTSQNNETRQGATGGTYGNDGGNGATSNSTNNQRGGGGGGACDTNGTCGDGGNGGGGGGSAGAGGTGKDFSAFFGSAVGDGGWFGGGGGGGKRNASGGSAGSGGQGGGGAGSTSGAGSAGMPNTGGGGGGSGGSDAASNAAAAGGSGLVLVRYIPQPTGAMRAVHVFTTNDTFTPPAGLTQVEVLVVGGGGGGGYPTDRTGGGGGAGGVIHNTAFAVGGPVSVTVGAGGSGGTIGSAATAGSNSVFGSLTAIGGGRGGAQGNLATTGGSGGGGYHNPSDSGRAGTGGQGNAGATGYDSGNTSIGFKGGGGGGAGGAAPAPSPTVDGAGGAGVLHTISGSAQFYAGGGAGGLQVYTGTVPGGSGVGGDAGANGTAGSVGAPNTGSGGGGGSENLAKSVRGNGGNGGSGIVIVSYVPPMITYVTHTFTTVGDSSFTPPPGVTSVELLVVGGGGGGGSRHGGGGGGGGVVHHTNFAVTPGNSYNVTVGAGGSPGETSPTNGSVGTNGQPSDFADTVIALGGGGGGSYTAPVPTGGGSGGGGGGTDNNTAGTGDGAAGNRTGGLANQGNSGGGTGYGFNGGNGAGTGTNNPANFTGGGGGGGAGGAGGLAVGHLGGTGGNGFMTTFTGELAYFGGGGGGGSGAGAGPVAGGEGGGGTGGSNGGAGTSGTANTGGGGGGSRSDPTGLRGGSGGSGIVIVRYRPPTMTITQQPSTEVDSAQVFPVQPQVTLQTFSGTPISGVNVTAAIQSGSGTLGGTTTVATDGNGIAAFTNLSLTGTAGNFLLDFNAEDATGETVSNAIDLQSYHIRILHGTNYALCTPSTPITIEVRRPNNTLVTNFTGTVTLTNSGNHGDYSINTGGGSLSGAGGNDGAVTYTFAGVTDGGTATLNFTTAIPGNITFDATGTAGIIDDNSSGILDVGACQIRIEHDGNGNICTAENVTISIRDETGALVPSFTGTVQLSTSSGQGAWANTGGGSGTLVPGGGDGAAAYTFSVGDAGSAVLSLLHPEINNSVDIEAVSGLIAEDDQFVANFNFTACTAGPSQFALQCNDNGNTVSISVPPAGPGSNRLAVATVHRTGTLGGASPTASNVQFGAGGPNMTLLREAYINNGNVDSQTQIYGLLDASFPSGTGPFTVTATNTSTTRLCVIIYENVDQSAFTLPPPITNSLAMDTTGSTIETMLSPIVQQFTSNNAGYTIPAGVTQMDVLLIGGGGGGGRGQNNVSGGGGGAGGVRYAPDWAVTPGASAGVTIGGGGNGAGSNNTQGTTGGNTIFNTLPTALTAFGGGGGGGGDDNGVAGASGGGAGANNNDSRTGGAATVLSPMQGFAGGNSFGGGNAIRAGGGGGGGGGVGAPGASGVGGAGGPGYTTTITGVVTTYAGGGGGASSAGGAGGAGGGANGGSGNNSAGTATANTGSGGGGTRNTNASAGAAGRAILRYGDPAITGEALVISAVSATLGANGARTWTPLDSDMQARLFNSTSVNNPLSFAVSSGFVTSNLGGTKVTETHNGADSNRRTQVLAAFRAAAPVLDHFRITHGGTGGTCGPNMLTITAVDQYGSVLTNYTGTVDLNAGSGTWGQGLATNAPVNGGAGAATYTFHANDQGVAVLAYSNSSFGSIDFDVEAGGIIESPFFDAPLNLQSCEIRMSHVEVDGSTCAINTVTLGVYTPGVSGALVPYVGTVTLNTVLVPGSGSGGGDWSVIDGDGGFDNGTPNDGIATYTFDASDGGEVTLGYSKTAAGTVNFNPVAAGLVVSGSHDANLVLTNCFFRISHDGSGDVCTPELITISVVNGNGVQQTNYVGSINLTTPTGSGDWSVASAVNSISNLGSGAASYTFAAADGGDIQLYLRHHAKSEAGFVIGANSGTFGVQGGFNPPLFVAGCTLRFSLLDATGQTCSSTQVTVGVYDSTGMLATAYTGTIALSTSTGHGSWVSTTGPGSLSNNTPNTGAASYTFVAGDAGDAVIEFTNNTVETLNFNANSAGLHPANAIVVDTTSPAYDPNLSIASCLPDIAAVACYPNQDQADAITLQSSAQTLGSRMVLIYVGSESTSTVSSVTFENQLQAPSLLRTQAVNSGGTTLTLQVYGLLDAHLPASAGSYDVEFTGSANNPAMCIVSVTGVAQSFPATVDDTLDGTGTTTTTNRVETAINVPQNNSLIVGVAMSSIDGADWGYFTNLDERLWDISAADPAGANWVGDYEYHLVASEASAIHEIYYTAGGTAPSSAGRRQAQIALVLHPVAEGPPGEGHFVPVTLYETFSGRVDYVAIGNSLRADGSDFGTGVGACEMPEAGPTPAHGSNTTGTTRALPLPSGATIKAAYLYWAGSGTEADIDDVLRFGPDGGTRPELTADKIFRIKPMKYDPQFDNVQYGVVNESYFAAYKDVTGLITDTPGQLYRASDLTIRVDGDWATWSSCVAGWSLVVVYEHPQEDLNVINLFHGFQPFWHSSLTLIPRNFRMATPDGVDRPHAQVTHVTFEGDSGINSTTEVLGLQDDPDMLTFTNLTNTVNPANNQYNETQSYPNYNANLDFTGSYTTITGGLGVDVDTYYVQGDSFGEHIYEFGATEAEQITTHYETGQDIVLLAAEFISVMNSPIADLEVFVTDSGDFKVGKQDTSFYQYSVTNNGDGGEGGYASGDVILTGNMPTGITIDNIAGTGWDCSLATATAFTCLFEIADDWTTGLGAAVNGQLAMNETLPLLTVTVDIDDESEFPLLDNPVMTVARLAHVGDYDTCTPEAAGLQPNPNPSGGCSRAPQFDNKNDLNKFLIDIDNLNEKSATNNNVHHVDTNVRGVVTNLAINKSLVGILEANEPAVYQLTVTNLGPDATSKVITVTDTLPPGLVPATASGTGWTCGISVQTVTCTRSAALGVGNTTPAITIETDDIFAPAVEGEPVTNTATVTPGQFNFDPDPSNDFAMVTSVVTGPLAASSEKFLLSVSADGSTIGGLEFNAGDLVIYDPVTDTAVMYIAEELIPGTTDLGDINALHLLPNGHVLLSTATDGSSINGLTFNAEDIVMYDPLLHTVTLVFDGSAIFNSDSADIDAIHVLYNNSYSPQDWDILLSTTDTATIGALTFQDNDIVNYNMGSGVATLRVDGNGADMFGPMGEGDIGALHLRHDESAIYVVSTSDEQTTIGVSGENQSFERGELVEIDLRNPGNPETDPLFCDDQDPCKGPLGEEPIFTPPLNTRRLDAVHIIESGYMGHFSITSSGGDVCSQTKITIRKHGGLTHTTETHYRGTIIISNGLGDGNWSKVNPDGILVPLGSDTGMAMYTFAASDAGVAELYISDIAATNAFNVNVRTVGFGNEEITLQTITQENAPSEDPNIVISELVTPITYSDQFSSAAYTNNDGAAQFASGWTEVNDDNLVNNGKIRIASNQLRFNNYGGGGAPELIRQIDFSTFGVETTPTLSFDYTIIGSPTGTFVAEARGNDGASWVPLQSITAASGSGTYSGLPFTGLTLSDTTQIRFRIVSGYDTGLPANQYIAIDNVVVATETHDCGVGGAVDHYAIVHDGSMLSCLAELITISPHANGDLVVEPGLGTVITLQTSTNKGFWGPPLNGSGLFTTPSSDNGFATYAYLNGETELVFPFYYTELADDIDPNVETVTISVSDNNVPSVVQLENSALTVAKTGLRFFNETTNSDQFPTLVSGMPSSVFPAQVLTVQAVRSSDSNPGVCEPAFVDGSDVLIELAFECSDPMNCSASTLPVQVTNNNNTVDVEPVDEDNTTGVNTGAFVSMPLRFTTNGSFSRAQIALNYGDAGAIQIHGRHNIVVEDEDGLPLDSNDYMSGSGDTFVVRPFAFDIDFTLDRDAANGDCAAASSCAANANGSVFAVAGEGFNTTLRAVAWQPEDDDSNANGDVANDGVPDSDANLFDNATTPSFGNEADAGEDNVTLTHALAAAMPMGSVDGALTDFVFTDFSAGGQQMHSVRYSEVGIIDLFANLDSEDYLGGQQGISGHVRNVGRFIPSEFAFSVPMLTARPLFSPSTAGFTYMGEEFTAAFTLTARNSGGATTQNYFGDFAKLSTPAQLDFRGVEDGGAGSDTSYSARLSKVAGGPNPLPADFVPSWDAGVITLDGNLVLDRRGDGTPDGPLGPLKIAVRATDSDGVVDSGRNVTEDVDACNPDCTADPKQTPSANLIGEHEFRYGRIRLENAYGSEVPDLDEDSDPIGRDVTVRVVAEYFDGTDFVVNTDDIATPYDSAELDFVAGTYTDSLGAGEAAITPMDEPGIVYRGQTFETSGQDDVPMYLRAPGESNEGTALVELDLDALGLSFLKFDWRDADEDEDVKADPDDYSTPDNPRAFIEFGTFRGNDRIINWQEIFE